MNFKIFDLKTLFPKLVNVNRYHLYSKNFNLSIQLNNMVEERTQNSAGELFQKFYDFEFERVEAGIFECKLPKDVCRAVRCTQILA